MGLLDSVLGLFTGGGGVQQPTAAQPGPSQQQAPGQGGLSPLAQSLLAGYFAGIGSPKLSGWGGAVSKGGLAALQQYDNAQYAQSMDAYRRAQAAKLAADTGADAPEMRAQYADSIRKIAAQLSDPAQKAALEQTAAGVEMGAIDGEKGYQYANEMVKSATATHFGVSGETPFIQKGMDVYTPQQTWHAGQQPQAQPPVQQQPITPSQPPAQAPNAPGSKMPGFDLDIPPEHAEEVKQFMKSELAKGTPWPEIIRQLSVIYGPEK